MVGVCVTVIGIVRLLEVHSTMATIVDNVVAVASALFLTAALTSYGSIRTHKHQERLERYADLVFLGGLVIMVVASFMLAWEIGQHPIAKP
jgi:small basic protein